MIGRNSSEDLLKKIVKLDTVEFLGVCKILGVDLYNVDEPLDQSADDEQRASQSARDFTDIWCDLCDKVENLSRTRRRNLNRLVSKVIKRGK